MLIVHIITGLHTGGAELMLERLIGSHSGSALYTHRVISLGTIGSVGARLQSKGVEVEALGLQGPKDVMRVLARLAKTVRSAKPDIVQTWMYHADLIGGLAARFAGTKRIIWGVRIADINREMGVPRSTLAVRRACAFLSPFVPQKIVYVAQSARLIHEKLGYAASKSVFVPNGYVIPDAERLHSARLAFRHELGAAPDTILIGSAGRFSPQKGYRSFIEAAGELASADRRIRVVLMGRDVDWENQELANWVKQSRAPERFQLLGERKDLVNCLAALDIFCLNSLGEGFPNVVAEAMSAGVPCVVTDVGDAAFLVGETGKVVPPSNPGALREAIEILASCAPGNREALGQAARRRIVDNFSLDAARQRFEDLYAEVGRLPPGEGRPDVEASMARRVSG